LTVVTFSLHNTANCALKSEKMITSWSNAFKALEIEKKIISSIPLMLSIQIVAVIKDMLVEYENMLVDG